MESLIVAMNIPVREIIKCSKRRRIISYEKKNSIDVVNNGHDNRTA